MNLLEKIEHSKNLIENALDRYSNVKLSCSFGKDSMVVLHLALQVKHNIVVFVVLTPMKPKETYFFKDRIKMEWDLNLEEYESVHEVVSGLWKTNPDECCRIFKVLPTQRALKGVNCWITGLRNTEGQTRVDYKEIEDHGYIIKLNPILTWTEREIWQYLATNEIPVHSWYREGYRSLGCKPCTAMVNGSESERNGRWKGTEKCAGECGIHTMHKMTLLFDSQRFAGE